MVIKGFRIAAFLLLIGIVDQVSGLLLHRFYFKQSTGPNWSLNYVFSECKADIVIFGNSRAQHHYESKIIGDSLKMSCYNAGQDGGHSILLPYAQIEVMLRRYTPKIIILEFDPTSIYYNAEDYAKLAILLPYYNVNPELHPLLELRSPFEKAKLLSGIYPYNSCIINIIRFNTMTNASRKKDIKGYVSIANQMLNKSLIRSENIESKIAKIDTNKLIALRKIIYQCKEKKVVLFIVNSPTFQQINGKQTYKTLISKTATDIIRNEKINYYNFSSDSTFGAHVDWFADINHLNEKGATIFSQLIADSIRLKFKTGDHSIRKNIVK